MLITKTATTLLLSSIFTAMCICSIPAFGADPAEQPRKIMLASTIGPIDAGIVGALEDAFTKEDRYYSRTCRGRDRPGFENGGNRQV